MIHHSKEKGQRRVRMFAWVKKGRGSIDSVVHGQLLWQMANFKSLEGEKRRTEGGYYELHSMKE